MKKILLALMISTVSIVGMGQAGNLDSTFGINGLVRTDFGFNIPSSYGRDLIVQDDESFYLLIGVGDNATFVAHFFANGNLDSSYGENGYSEILPFAGAGRAVLQGDGKLVIGGSGSNNGNHDFLLIRLTTDGTLDNSFSEDGKQYTGFSFIDVITALAIQSDGKILAAGNAGQLVAMARYNPDGSLDNTFSGDGKLTGQPGMAWSIAVQNDGKILLTFSWAQGFSFTGTSVARYLQDGTLDSGFGTGGRRSFSFGPGAAFKSVAVQRDGKIVLGGITSAIPGYEDFLVIRLDSNGVSDSSFSGDGIQTTDFFGASRDKAEALALANDGKILLAGSTSFSPNVNDIAVARYNSDGSLDNSFSGDGIVTTSINEADFGVSMALLSDSRIMVAGTSSNFLTGFENYYACIRYDVVGNLDNSFNGDGILVDSKPDGLTQFFTSAIQPDGGIIAAGHTWASPNNSEFAIARFNKDGTLDYSFSQDGRQTVGFGYGNDIIQSIKIQLDGKIIAAGVGFNGINNDFAITRFNLGGSLDSSFSDDGILLTDFSGDDGINDIEIQSDGRIVAAGYSTASGNQDFTIARYNADGTLDNSFSGDGRLIFDFAPRLNAAVDLIIQPDGKLVIVGNYNIQVNSDVAIVRLNPDGTTDPSFDGDGMVVTDIGAGNNDNASAAELQNDGKIITAGTITLPSGRLDFLLVRINTDGSSDTSFSSDGKLIFDLGSNTESASSLAILENGKILVGGIFFRDDGNGDFALVRLNPNGTADSSFAGDGVAIPEIKYGADYIASLNIFSNRVYAVGNTTYGNTLGSVAAFLLSEPVTNPLVVNIPDTFALPKGVEINTVYIGYEPASKLTLVAETSGGAAPYTYKWSNGATTASIIVGPFTTTNYSVIVTDANGTTNTASKMVKVFDVRCGYKLDKVLICHKEKGNSNQSATLCISADAVASHLRHGDNLGSCRQSDESDFLTISAHPNPSQHSFELSTRNGETVGAELFVWNILGKIIERRTIYTNSTIRIGAWYKPGIYLVEVKYKNKRARTKLIKLAH